MTLLATNLDCIALHCVHPLSQPSGPRCKMGLVAPTWEGRKASW